MWYPDNAYTYTEPTSIQHDTYTEPTSIQHGAYTKEPLVFGRYNPPDESIPLERAPTDNVPTATSNIKPKSSQHGANIEPTSADTESSSNQHGADAEPTPNRHGTNAPERKYSVFHAHEDIADTVREAFLHKPMSSINLILSEAQIRCFREEYGSDIIRNFDV